MNASQKRFFLVPTMGLNGAGWLGNTINLHPEIKCTMGLTFGHVYPYSRFEEYRKDDEYWLYHHKVYNAAKAHLGIDRFLEDISFNTDLHFVGDVHGYDIPAYNSLLSRFGAPKDKVIALAALMRHPVTWVDANAKRYESMYPGRNPMILAPAYDSLIQQFSRQVTFDADSGFDTGSTRCKAFVYACLIYIRDMVVERAHTIRWKTFKMEDLQRDPDRMVDLLLHLTGGEVGITDSYLNEVYEESNRQFGQYTGRSRGGRNEEEVFRSWMPYERKLFIMMMHHYRMKELFEPLGYDLTFCKS